jgi:RHS repeat-associated protein
VPGCETFIRITQYPTEPWYSSTATITVEYGDVQTDPWCLSYGGTNYATLVVAVNGVDRTSSFSVGGNQAVGTVTLTDDYDNSIEVQIEGNDLDGNPRTETDYQIVHIDFTPAPSVDLAANNFATQDVGRCEVACFAGTYAQSTVPYFSLDTPRNVALVHQSGHISGRPFLFVDVWHPGGTSNTPQKFWLEARYNSALLTFTNGETRLYFTGSADTLRIGGQLDVATWATGVYTVQLTVASVFSTKTETSVMNTTLTVVNDRASAVARGWTVAGVQRANAQADGSVLITEGNGSAVYFNKPCSNCSFTTPLGEFTTLVANGTSGWYRYYPDDSTRVTFDNTGRMTQVLDRFGDATNFVYDGSGRLSKIQDPTHNAPASREITLAYGTYGLASITDPMSRVTYVTVGSDSLLRAIRDPDGDSTRFGYDSNGRLDSIIDRRGSLTRIALRSPSWLLDTLILPAVSINGGSSESPRIRFSPWQLTVAPMAATATTAFTSSKRSNVRGSVTDGESHTTAFTVDRWGQTAVSFGPLSDTTRLTRNGDGLATSIQYPWSATDNYTYDSRGRLTSHTPPGLSATNFHVGAYGQVDSIWGSNQARVRIYLGTGGRADSVRIAALDTLKTRIGYDSRGRVTLVDDNSRDSVRYHYDGTFGNRDSVLAPGGRFSRVRFDQYGRDSVSQVQHEAWRRVIYDVLNRPTELYDTVGAAATLLTYDKLFLVRVRDPLSQYFRFQYNALGWLERRYDPADTSGTYDAYRYDRDGRLTGWTNRRGQALSYGYDALDRILAKTGTNTVADSFAYSADFRRLARWNNIERDSAFLNAILLPDTVITRVAGRRFEFHYYRNTVAAMDSVRIRDAGSGGLAFSTRGYARNDTTFVTNTFKIGSQSTSVVLNRDYLPTQVNWPTSPALSMTTNYTQHHQSMVDEYSDATVNATLGRSWAYDSLSRVRFEIRMAKPPASTTPTAPGRAFSYDRLGRVATEVFRNFYNCSSWDIRADGYSSCWGGTDSTRTYTYDAVGNRTDNSGSYATGNRIQSFAGLAFAHDSDGNVIRKISGSDTTRYYWSAEGRLDSVRLGSNTVRYDYDVGGRLVRRRRTGQATHYLLWHGDQLLVELDSTGTQRIEEYAYFPGIDAPLAIITGNGTATTRYVAQDRLGNVTGVFTGNSIAQSLLYDAWGRQTVSGTLGDTNRLRWKGLLWDGDVTQLYFMRNRWYDPQTGRFVSEDPIGLGGGVNVYAFAAGNPIAGFDPYGLDGDQQCDKTLPPDPTAPPPPKIPGIAKESGKAAASEPCHPDKGGDEGGPVPPGSTDCLGSCYLPPSQPGTSTGSGGPGPQQPQRPPPPKRPPPRTCSGSARVVAPGIVGGIGAWQDVVTSGTAAIALHQWHVGKGVFRGYRFEVSGSANGVTLFRGVTDRMGPPSWVRLLERRNPGKLLLELNGGQDMGVVYVQLTIPGELSCPAGTR